MGLLSALFGKNGSNNIRRSKYNESDHDTFYKFYRDTPNFEDYVGRKYNIPAYSDKYKTDEGFKLRELLLLIWWGKLKNGRKSDVIPPKYFFYNYNLDYDEATNAFLKKGLLEVKDEKMLLTEKGKLLSEKYKALWEIHSFKGISTNLDLDFINWDLNNFSLLYYKSYVNFLEDYNKHYEKMNIFLENSTYPNSVAERKDEVKRNNYEIKRNNEIIIDYKEKIKIIESKLK